MPIDERAIGEATYLLAIFVYAPLTFALAIFLLVDWYRGRSKQRH